MRHEDGPVRVGGGPVAFRDRRGGGAGADNDSVLVAQAVEDGLAAQVYDREPQGEVAGSVGRERGLLGG
ncbi:hypothetical protein OG711_07955 [Streptomyces uncialis]|uniref:hypothetical protein n=1 Tax=Streptomyces uncialis TaxID=1048205 RepID=UPI002E300BA2|nr:hypothetical protein [Streptomyces uncialis]